MTKSSSTYPEADIKGIELSIISDQDILRASVLEVLEPVGTKRNQPSESSILDLRLGPSVANLRCGTCGASVEECSGHTGHYNLAVPCALGEFVHLLHKILNSVCFRCSRILGTLSAAKRKKLLNMKDFGKSCNELNTVGLRSRVCWIKKKKKVKTKKAKSSSKKKTKTKGKRKRSSSTAASADDDDVDDDQDDEPRLLSFNDAEKMGCCGAVQSTLR